MRVLTGLSAVQVGGTLSAELFSFSADSRGSLLHIRALFSLSTHGGGACMR